LTGFRLKVAAFFYSSLAVSALIWVYAANGSWQDLIYHPDKMMTGQSLIAELLTGGSAGVAFGLGMAKLSKYLVYNFAWAKGMHIEFRGILGPLRNTDVTAFAAFSALGEELFFRGALQTSLGIIISSLIFGLLHIGPSKKFIPWPFQAVAMGFAFGGLFWLTGTIIAPVMAHFVINYQNLHFINRYDPSLQLPKSLTESPSYTDSTRR
jgi:membrane protease YdiL (CAAX protease family)